MTAVNKRGAAHYLLVAFSLLVLSFLIAPILIIIAVSFSPGEMIIFPPQGLSLRWYRGLKREGHDYFPAASEA